MTEENKTSGGFNISYIVIIVLVIALVWVIWSNYDREPSLEPVADQAATVNQSLDTVEPQVEAEAAAINAEIDGLLLQFGKLILFPAGERPQLATIENAESIAAENPFFIGSQDDDKVLIYLQAGKAYVLSPSRNLVVNVGPVVNESGATAESEISSAPAAVSE